MRTLLFTIEYPPFKGGVANYYGNLMKNFPDELVVLHNNDRKLTKWWIWPKWLPAIWQLKQTIKKNKINHVLVGHLLPLGTVAYFVCQKMNIPYSVFIHGMDITFAMRKKRKKKIAIKILQNAKNIICVSEYTKEIVKKFLESSSGGESVKTLKSKLMAEKLHVVNPGIEPLITRNQETITQIENKYELKNKTVLFSIGRLVKRKGVDMAIKAMSEVLRVVPNLYYVIAGTGPDEKYLKKLTNNNKNIIFIGSPNDTEKWAWMEKCDIFIQLSRKIVDDFEGFGIVYLEAALYGKPVIAGDSGGVSDAVLGGTTGILVNPEKIDRIASAIIRLATDKETAKKLGEQGRKRAMEEFNWQGQAKKIHDIISL
ncbi:hypothetical protein A2331_04490 [Candidatus Falkowbacteria bacterium RIFOXYB2_FULL_34_18]|uniref:Glycosyl transferase family 1 domain-containing protein n=1 Tax=Candidatus Falkowbacteria bacterium RIFOXYD2_FULL_34_120 TaxID=1798007 RepID=A0A1F5TM79_9BACT|nr:MAG: hypothetical protein A2331_04490 [Candidatus Falkowbacteria bacterium RIFOXYB2_FULL_34_18]OGF30292.1 MAG: hypothetical protein A2500_06870 [Candidatus Falkowbacteria bacterium RIFOXYC12_FULL_34_55]OGF37843.1 MAG: hypothetical protein A2466_03995 [Candidatus Falkowbacteria bacterium RIFOXYC2_FULL_34_220]OGF39604.1 MAG: hypothetical protein A2515_03710 [Candidatus Falkowbacteria bacterium RIFOXYD12_FULL_34_57]OGF40028.1 MAG: hypothetical protein A2531_07440 [Candidatus Falkowbacteria bact